MTDEDTRIQRILEGKCGECGKVLPNHETGCTEHPYSVMVNWLQKHRTQLEKITQNEHRKKETLNNIMKKIRKKLRMGRDDV